MCSSLNGDADQLSSGLPSPRFEMLSISKAEPLQSRAIAILEKTLGTECAKVVTSLEDYALLLRKIGPSEEADPMESRAHHQRQARYGKPAILSIRVLIT